MRKYYSNLIKINSREFICLINKIFIINKIFFKEKITI